MMVLEAAAWSALRAHAASAYPDECCGVLIGRLAEAARTVTDAWPMENAAATAARRYLITAPAYQRVEARARDNGAAVLGFYHSHPDAPAEPSRADVSEAWPNLDYIIIAVEQGTPSRMTCWRLRDDRSGFVREDMTWPTES